MYIKHRRDMKYHEKQKVITFFIRKWGPQV